jgi:hypothetical protein
MTDSRGEERDETTEASPDLHGTHAWSAAIAGGDAGEWGGVADGVGGDAGERGSADRRRSGGGGADKRRSGGGADS